jgi:hypothetical protein
MFKEAELKTTLEHSLSYSMVTPISTSLDKYQRITDIPSSKLITFLRWIS